jgi:hypothetical protein
MKCPVCYEEEHLKHLNCSHLLCMPCYKKLHQKQCPLCRIPINQNLFIYIPPLYRSTSPYRKFKEKLELFFRRRNLLDFPINNKPYRKFLFYMLHYGNVFYYNKQYYPLNIQLDIGFFSLPIMPYKSSTLLDFYYFLITKGKDRLPSIIHFKLIRLVENTFDYL